MVREVKVCKEDKAFSLSSSYRHVVEMPCMPLHAINGTDSGHHGVNLIIAYGKDKRIGWVAVQFGKSAIVK